MKRINNDYDSLASLWWSEDEGAATSIRYLINPARFAYFKRHLEASFKSGYEHKTALDVGCGGGFLAEELSKIGLRVTGVDPSKESIRVAREHATRGGHAIEYRVSFGEKLPFDDSSFDMAFCCDVLEHVDDVRKVISEIARVLKKGGLFFFDTINRTLMSRIVVIFFLQQCPLTSFGRADSHSWDKFITPEELRAVLSRNGIVTADIRGLGPARISPAMLLDLYRAAHKSISYRDLAERLSFGESDDLGCSYMGYGIKGAS